MTDGYWRTVEHFGRTLDERKHEYRAARQRYDDALEPLEEAILSRSRRYETESDLEQMVTLGSRVAKDVLESGGDTDDAARAVHLELDRDHPTELHNFIAQKTAEKIGEGE